MTTPRLVKPSTVGVTPEVTPRAITFEGASGGFKLTKTGVIVTGDPEFGDWENTMDFADYAEQKSPFWKAGLLNYAYSRAEWLPFLDAIVDRWALTPKTLDQYRSVDRRVPKANRVDGLTFSHHEAVASLPSDDEGAYLEEAKRGHLSVSALKQKIRHEKPIKRVLRGQDGALAKAQRAVAEHAHEAAHLCRQIAAHDCQDAEKMLVKARRELDKAEDALGKLRKAQGK